MPLSQKPQTTSSPTVSVKVFQWFEKMKDNYDQNIQNILSQFEKSSEKHQARLDKSNTEHIVDLKNQHAIQTAQSDKTIRHLEHNVDDYKVQITTQQQTINQLNSRYDAVISQLLSQSQQVENIKDILSDEEFSSLPPKKTNNETIKNTGTLEDNIQFEDINEDVKNIPEQARTDTFEASESVHTPEQNLYFKRVEPSETSDEDLETTPLASIENVDKITAVSSDATSDDITTSTENITEKQSIEFQVNPNEQVTDNVINVFAESSIEKEVQNPVNALCEDDETEKNTAETIFLSDESFSQAVSYREQGNHTLAFTLFTQAAQANHLKAMGSLGRAYFLAEGTDENQPLGLAWLIQAANKNLPQAINRVEKYKLENEDLYEQAKTLSDMLFSTD